MGRDDDIEAILEHGRSTRKPTPRWLWIAAAVAGVICGIGFLVVVLGDGEPARAPLVRQPAAGPGFGIGLVIGACAGVVIGFSIARQRGGHSSRNRP